MSAKVFAVLVLFEASRKTIKDAEALLEFGTKSGAQTIEQLVRASKLHNARRFARIYLALNVSREAAITSTANFLTDAGDSPISLIALPINVRLEKRFRPSASKKSACVKESKFIAVLPKRTRKVSTKIVEFLVDMMTE